MRHSLLTSLLSLSQLPLLLFLISISHIASAHPSTGCDPKATKPVDWKPLAGQVKLFRVNDRNVRVTVPSKFDATKPASMIVAYHDQDSSAEVLDYETGFSEDGVNEDVIVVYPAADEGRWSSELRPKKLDASSSPKSENYTTDITFTKLLLHDLSTLLCIDTTRIYATGLGSGGGMMHLLACDEQLSTQIAAFAAVGGGFGRAPRKIREGEENVWATCAPGRKSLPILEIHGTDDGIFGYYLREGENGKMRTIPKDWVEDWAERNGCGDTVDDAAQSDSDTATFLTELESGYMTESVQYGGAVVKVARQCSASIESGSRAKAVEVPNGALKTADTTVLHYQVKGYGHGWPRQQLRGANEVMFKDTLVRLETDDMFFDTSKIVLDFFKAHTLPEHYAKMHDDAAAAAAQTQPQQGQMPKMELPSAEEFDMTLRKVNQESRLPGYKPKWSEKEIREKVQQFKDAQLQKAEGYKEEIVPDDGGDDDSGQRSRDEL